MTNSLVRSVVYWREGPAWFSLPDADSDEGVLIDFGDRVVVEHEAGKPEGRIVAHWPMGALQKLATH
jgi:hypothetical protein